MGVLATVKTWYSRKYAMPANSPKLCGVSVRYTPVERAFFQVAPRSVDRAMAWPDPSTTSASSVPSSSAVINQKEAPSGAAPRRVQDRPSALAHRSVSEPSVLTA